MAEPNSGFCSQTRTYRSLRPKLDLPPLTQPLSITQFVFSLLHSSSTTTTSTFMINATTGHHLTYSDLISQTNSLALSLQKHYSLSKGDVVFIRSQTRTYRSLRPKLDLPPLTQPLSITQFVFSLLHSSSTTTTSTFMINATTGHHLTYSDLISQTNSLALSLQKHYSLSKGDVVFILSPHSLQIPILYFSLLSLGVIISPTNPDDSNMDITHQINLCRPTIAFSTSHFSHKLPSNLPTVLIDSPEFLSLLTQDNNNNLNSCTHKKRNVVSQSDVAAIIYSSGTTGRNKGVLLTHRNLIVKITIIATQTYFPTQPAGPNMKQVSLTTRALAGVFGLTVMMRAVTKGETLVLLERLEFEEILKAVNKYRANYMPVSPSEIVALLKSDLTYKYDLSSLTFLRCSGAPLGEDVAHKFREKFPNVQIVNGYGLTETGGVVASLKGPNEIKRFDSVGRLSEFMEAKIVDPITAEPLLPGQKGELWLRGPAIMKGYVGDDKATAEILDSEGWLKTGDLCYFDSQAFLFIVDRLKELIKYKAYQVPPAELEHLLQTNPEIIDAAVIPYPDEETGQVPMAFVVRKPGSQITEVQVMDFIAKQVPPYKRIRRVAFVNSIPKSSAGKILRKQLVDHALSATLFN